jgi:hypothetical protein
MARHHYLHPFYSAASHSPNRANTGLEGNRCRNQASTLEREKMEFVVPHLSTASSSAFVISLKKWVVLGAETSAISEEYFTLLQGTKLTDHAGGRKVIDCPVLGPKASLDKGIVTVPIPFGSVQLEVEILKTRIFENAGDLIGFMSLKRT